MHEKCVVSNSFCTFNNNRHPVIIFFKISFPWLVAILVFECVVFIMKSFR